MGCGRGLRQCVLWVALASVGVIAALLGDRVWHVVGREKHLFGALEVVDAVVDSVAGDSFDLTMVSFRDKQALGAGARSALILGATGATGGQVLREVLSRPGWGRVVVVGRRAPDQSIAEGLGKEQPEFIELKSLADQAGQAAAADKLQGVDHFFNCVGTTRSAAGSAQAFHDIEVGVTQTAATLAADGGIKSASVVSAQGASANRSCAPMWFHPLFYGKTMGLKERAMTSAGFDRVTIFRPGMLDRSDPNKTNDRATESLLTKVFGGLKVATLASAMVNDAEAALPTSKEDTLMISGNTKITQYGKL